MDEFEIIRRYFDRETIDESIIAGIGDDGAVTRPIAGRDLVTVIDSMVAGVHFPLSLHPADVGYRAVAVNLSDIAAMAAIPKWMTLALTLDQADPAWIEDFAKGLFAAADEHGVSLIGGDTTHGSEKVVTIQITGMVEVGAALMRSGASAGESIFVTGSVGDAAAGLSILQSGAPSNADTDYLVRRFTRPTARVSVGRKIGALAGAAIDLSDGLFTDTEKLLSASGLSGIIETDLVPLSAELQRTMARDDALKFALGGGDDYELCFTSAASEDEINESIAECGVAVTRIGSVGEGRGLSCTMNGERYAYRDDGYRHFR